MTTPSHWLRPLSLLAVGLGVLNGGLLVAWIRMDPPVVAAVDPVGGRETKSPSKDLVVPGGAAEPEQAQSKASEGESPVAERPKLVSAVLFGMIRHADGKPVKRGSVRLYRDGETVGSASVQEGSYVFAGLGEGTHRLSSRAPDALPLDRQIEIRAPSTRLDIELAPRWLLTVNAVTPEGEPLLKMVNARIQGRMGRSITACAFSTPLAGDLPQSNSSTVAAGLGPFRGSDPFHSMTEKALPKHTVGILTLPPGEPAHIALLMRNHVVAQLEAKPGQEEVTFTVDVDEFIGRLATVRVRLVDESGAPVTEAMVALNDAQTGGGGGKVGPDGRATLKYLKPGLLDLEVRHAKLRAPYLLVDVPPGANLDLGDVVLRPPTKVDVATDNFGGKGYVRLYLLDTPAGMAAKSLYLGSDKGETMSRSFYPGRYLMLASAPNGVCFVEVDLRTAPTEPIRFDLRAAAPLFVDCKIGRGFAQYHLETSTGVALGSRDLTGFLSYTSRLPPGRYTAVITAADGKVTRRVIKLTPAGSTLTIR